MFKKNYYKKFSFRDSHIHSLVYRQNECHYDNLVSIVNKPKKINNHIKDIKKFNPNTCKICLRDFKVLG